VEYLRGLIELTQVYPSINVPIRFNWATIRTQ